MPITSFTAGTKPLATDVNANFSLVTPEGIFGDGSDGALTFNGSSTILGMVPSSNTYTMTRDIYGTTITVNSGVKIITAGWRIFASVSLNNAGTIHNNGGAGVASTNGTAQPTGFFKKGENGLAVAAGTSFSVGGNGGNGGSQLSPGVINGGLAGAVPANCGGWRHIPMAFTLRTIDAAGTSRVFEGGAGGSAGTAEGGSGLGGGAGAGGGILAIIAKSITNTGTISANGGNGENGANATGTGRRGGGGGGGGGAVILVYMEIPTVGTVTANGGNGGTATVGASAGTAGAAGTVLQIKV
jgi:hypothetical protein